MRSKLIAMLAWWKEIQREAADLAGRRESVRYNSAKVLMRSICRGEVVDGVSADEINDIKRFCFDSAEYQQRARVLEFEEQLFGKSADHPPLARPVCKIPPPPPVAMQ